MTATQRVLLTLPPDIHNLEIYKVLGLRAPPLGLAWIASVLEREGHKVKIIDSPTLELGVKEWLEEVKSWHPDIIGISMFTPIAVRGYDAIKLLREEIGNDIIIFTGGPHPTYMYDESLDVGADVVVRGEGEYTTLELVNIVEKHGLDYDRLKHVKGIAFRDKSGTTIVTPNRPFIMDLDELPWPARHLLPMDKYTLFGKPIKIAHVMASRGCPYGCIYCITSYFWGRRLRFRSAQNVVDEIEFLRDKYKVNHIAFTDDEFTVNRKFLQEFLSEIKKRGLDISYSCGSRVDHVDKKILTQLKDSGCTALYFGVESASQETIDKIGKKIRIEQAIRVFNWKKEVGIFTTASFILGFPWESTDDMKRTVEFAIRLDPDYAQFTVLTPYPGTPLYKYALEHNLIEDFNWENYTTIRPVMRGFKFTRKDLARMIKYAYYHFYLRPKFLWRELKGGRFKEIFRIIAKNALSTLGDKILGLVRGGAYK